MANRNQSNQSGRMGRQGRDDYSSSNPYRSRDADDGDYGPYRDSDEGDSSVRAGSYDQGREQYGRRDTNEQSGSTGRYAGYGNFGQGDYSGGRGGYSGQDRYGQSGWGQGGYQGGTYDEPNYGGSGMNRSRGFSGYGYEAGSGQSSGYGGSRSGYGGDSGGQRWRGQSGGFSESGYGGASGWTEPYGEGQQYTSRGQYGGQSGNQYGGQFGGQYGSQAGEYGEQGTGMHRGKGPKGYQRSDDRLKELICERLRDDPQIDPSEVTITVQGGKVTLEGTVDSRQAKNAIEDIADQFGVQDVQNNLRVQRASQTEGGKSTSGKSGSEDGEKGGKQNKH
jgi:osmotically-inducible protein OsmY